MSAELKVTMTTDELIKEIRRKQASAWECGWYAASKYFQTECDMPDNPYGREDSEVA